MRRFIVAALSLGIVMAGAAAFAQAPGAGGQPPQKVLSQELIDRFIADMPGLMKDFKALGEEYKGAAEPGSGGPGNGMPDAISKGFAAIRADARAHAILTRHGWNDSYWQVYSAILFGYMAAMMDEAYAQSQQPMMKQYGDQYRALVHPSDAALMAKNKDRIQQLFESMQDEG